MSEKKLVEAFKTFFEKSVAPYVSSNDEILREWNHLNKIISADPIDYSQIEFYLLLSNKGGSSPSQPLPKTSGSFNRIPDSDPNRFRYSDFNVMMDKNNFEKKGSYLSGTSNKKYLSAYNRKNLIANLESFQKMLLYNHERLENMNKKDGSNVQSGNVNTSVNGIPLRKYG